MQLDLFDINDLGLNANKHYYYIATEDLSLVDPDNESEVTGRIAEGELFATLNPIPDDHHYRPKLVQLVLPKDRVIQVYGMNATSELV